MPSPEAAARIASSGKVTRKSAHTPFRAAGRIRTVVSTAPYAHGEKTRAGEPGGLPGERGKQDNAPGSAQAVTGQPCSWSAGSACGATDDGARARDAAAASLNVGETPTARVEKAFLVPCTFALTLAHYRTGVGWSAHRRHDGQIAWKALPVPQELAAPTANPVRGVAVSCPPSAALDYPSTSSEILCTKSLHPAQGGQQ
jgi:hypothetical protein